MEARGKVEKRRTLVLPFFGRSHFLNRELGKTRHRILKSLDKLAAIRVGLRLGFYLPLLCRRAGHCHSMTSEHVHHLCVVGRAASCSIDDFGSFAEISRAHYRRCYDAELFRIHAARVIEPMHCASRNTQGLSGTNIDGCAVYRPRKYSLDTVEDLFVGVILVSWGHQFLARGDKNLKH